MSRMLEALKQIQTKSPETQPAVRPVSAEELEAFGVRRAASPATHRGSQAADGSQSDEAREEKDLDAPRESVQAARTMEPAKTGVSQEDVVESAPEQGAAKKIVEAMAQAAGAGVGSRPLHLSEPAQPHRDLADRIIAHWSSAGPAALMFTSVDDPEGKTITLAYLAAALAQRLAQEIVVLDVDFRSPALAAHLGVQTDRGLADVLTGRASWRNVVCKTGLKGVSVLPGGEPPTDDGGPPDGSRLAPLLAALRRHYRFVLLDTAPLFYPEVAPLTKLSDGTYLVVRLGQTGRHAARHAVRLIEKCGGRVVGCILTNAPAAE